MTTHPDLPYEQATNKEYLAKLEEKLRRNPLVSVARNLIWIDEVDHRIKANGFHHPLLGRVGSDTDDEDLRDFYIGSRFLPDLGVPVYSWAAPIARLFFQPGSDGSDDVVVRRTFTHALVEITDLDDEWTRDGASSPFTAAELRVPAPAPATTTRRRVTSAPAGTTDGATTPQSPLHPEAGTRDAAANGSTTRHALDIRVGMRAQDAVLKRLAAPRQDKLQSVLALMQPDQHALVSWPVDESLVVQGHPGTGKTVVAAYRAAYLVNPALYDPGGALESRSDKPLRVLVVGPTAGYVAHVDGLIKPLASSDQVRVTHLFELMAETTGLKGPWPGGIGGEHDDVDAQARSFAERAARIHGSTHRWREGNGARRENIKSVYELIRSNGTADRPLVDSVDQIVWMSKLPPFDQAFKRRYLPLMAQCRLSYTPIPDAVRYDHIIVDEAQDVSPIEWNVLDQYLRRDGQWTLVGDMNQRRSDVTYGSWREIADHLALSADEDFRPEVMTRGYRSTGAVLKFADRLLPARHRGNQTVQDAGKAVTVRHARRPSLLWELALQTATELASEHAAGSTAVITVNPGEMIGELGRRGWRREERGFNVWHRGELTLRLYAPEDARGLEFDAVVVVEPGAFPENLGRTGQLYTSLTRANRELAVVWHHDMPDALRRASRA